MAAIDRSMTLAEVVDTRPDLARELERWGLDYCCGGHRTLQQACAERGLDADAVTSGWPIAAPGGDSAPWTTLSVAELVDHLEATHHRYLWDELPRLAALIDKITAAHGDRHPELHAIASCFAEARADLEPHLMKEERVLFPMIRELAASGATPSFHCGTLRNPISVMLAEHDAVGALLARLRLLSNAYQVPADGCASYQACFRGLAELEADTHLHIHKENNVLFPMVVQMEGEGTA